MHNRGSSLPLTFQLFDYGCKTVQLVNRVEVNGRNA